MTDLAKKNDSFWKLSIDPKIINHAVRVAYGCIWLVAGAVKTLNFNKFQASIHSFKMLPWEAEWLLSRTLPWFEIILGIILIFHISKVYRMALWLSNALLIGFLIALAIAKFRGLAVICGCFGDDLESPASYAKLITRDLIFLAAGLWLWFKDRTKKKNQTGDQPAGDLAMETPE